MHRLLAILFTTLLVLAACGGDDDDADTATDEAASDEGDGTAGDDSGDEAPDADADDDAGDGIDTAGVFGDDDCEFLFAGSFLNPMAAIQPGSDVDLDDAISQFQAIADAAPDEIGDDMQLLVDRYAEFVNLFDGVDTSDPSAFQDPEVAAAFEDAEDIFDEDFQAAGEAVSDWTDENCTTG